MKLQSKKVFVACLVTLAMAGVGFVSGQKPASPSSAAGRTYSFEHGEELIYSAEVSRALLKKIDIAEFRFTAHREALAPTSSETSTSDNGATYSLKLTGDVSSKGFFTRLFNIRFRERIESTVEPASFTVQRTKRLDEHGKRTRASEAVYDHSKGTVSWVENDPTNSSSSPRTVSNSFIGRVQDVLSAIYYLRTQPLEVGKTFEVTISNSGRVFQVPVRVVEKRRMKTVLGRVEAIRVDPDVFGNDKLIRGQGQFSIWLVNDSKRIPAKARIKTEYGTFDITLRKVIENPALASSSVRN
jgi:hypothetical protein